MGWVDWSAEPWLSALGFFVFFVTLWVAVSFGLSRSGWHALALQYPASFDPDGKRYTVRHAAFGAPLAGYNNAIKAVFLQEGVYLCAVFVFRAFHAPMLVPWSAVRRVSEKRRWFGSYYVLTIEGRGRRLELYLGRKVEASLRQYCPAKIVPD